MTSDPNKSDNGGNPSQQDEQRPGLKEKPEPPSETPEVKTPVEEPSKEKEDFYKRHEVPPQTTA